LTDEDPLTILHLLDRWDTGGVRRNVTDLCAGLERAGFDVHIAAWTQPNYTGKLQPAYLPLYSRTGKRKSLTGFLRSLFIAAAYVRDLDPEIIHMHSRYVLPLGAFAATGTSTGLIYTSHRAFTDLGWLPWYPGTIIFPGETAKGTFLSSVRRGGVSGHVIPHGIHPVTEGDNTTREKPFKRPNSILFAGRCEQDKGGETLLEATAILKKKGSQDFTVTIIGDGSHKAGWIEQARQREIDDIVFFRGSVDDTRSCFADAGMLVVPSTGEESYGYVIVDAFAEGCPVIASGLPAFRERIVDGHNGLLFPPGDAPALAVALEYALKHPEKLDTMAIRARDTVNRDYDFGKMISRTTDLYTRIVREQD